MSVFSYSSWIRSAPANDSMIQTSKGSTRTVRRPVANYIDRIHRHVKEGFLSSLMIHFCCCCWEVSQIISINCVFPPKSASKATVTRKQHETLTMQLLKKRMLICIFLSAPHKIPPSPHSLMDSRFPWIPRGWAFCRLIVTFPTLGANINRPVLFAATNTAAAVENYH